MIVFARHLMITYRLMFDFINIYEVDFLNFGEKSKNVRVALLSAIGPIHS